MVIFYIAIISHIYARPRELSLDHVLSLVLNIFKKDFSKLFY